jgi:hypothetical protein
MKRIPLILTLLLLITIGTLPAIDVGISVGTFDARPQGGLVEEGVHVQMGLVTGFASRWEVETFVVTQASPKPIGNLMGGGAISFALMGPVYGHSAVDEIPPYGNAYLSLGFMGNPVDGSSYGPFLRINPISAGGPQFKLRERGATTGIYYNIATDSVTIFWNIFLLDFYL